MVRTPRKILLLAFPLCTVVFVCWQYLGNFPKVSLFLDALASLDFKLSVTESLMFFGFPVNQVMQVM